MGDVGEAYRGLIAIIVNLQRTDLRDNRRKRGDGIGRLAEGEWDFREVLFRKAETSRSRSMDGFGPNYN